MLAREELEVGRDTSRLKHEIEGEWNCRYCRCTLWLLLLLLLDDDGEAVALRGQDRFVCSTRQGSSMVVAY